MVTASYWSNEPQAVLLAYLSFASYRGRLSKVHFGESSGRGQAMIQGLRNVFVVLRASGMIAIVALFLHVEWRFIHGNPANAINVLVQLFVIGSVLILPVFWLLVVVTLVGHFGQRAIHNRPGRFSREKPGSSGSNA